MRRLPPGLYFEPTDEELVFHYLKSKIFSRKLPSISMILDINVYQNDPWNLPGNCDQKDKYFFSSNCQNQTTKSGYWKESESDKKVLPSLSDGIEGLRKTLVFYEGKSPNGSQTDWSMYQYRLVSSETTASNYSSQNNEEEIGDWVLCHVFNNKNRSME
ncbi:NAC domain-containing protein 83-like [Lotus japonicus]|uniref:NAC domain-containing protein 83-like n=1 Tax=Lotus japonicus TaxID=34305 RepID=UPI002582A6C3|nr:NAC domain-containing protein 83-like [Lotus japonicus]